MTSSPSVSLIKETWWGIMFICDMLLRCASTVCSSYSISDNHLQSYTLLINDVNTRSLTCMIHLRFILNNILFHTTANT